MIIMMGYFNKWAKYKSHESLILNYQILHFSHRSHYFADLTLTNLHFLFVELDHWLNDRICFVSIELDIDVLLQSYDDLVINSENS